MLLFPPNQPTSKWRSQRRLCRSTSISNCPKPIQRGPLSPIRHNKAHKREQLWIILGPLNRIQWDHIILIIYVGRRPWCAVHKESRKLSSYVKDLTHVFPVNLSQHIHVQLLVISFLGRHPIWATLASAINNSQVNTVKGKKKKKNTRKPVTC